MSEELKPSCKPRKGKVSQECMNKNIEEETNSDSKEVEQPEEKEKVKPKCTDDENPSPPKIMRLEVWGNEFLSSRTANVKVVHVDVPLESELSEITVDETIEIGNEDCQDASEKQMENESEIDSEKEQKDVTPKNEENSSCNDSDPSSMSTELQQLEEIRVHTQNGETVITVTPDDQNGQIITLEDSHFRNGNVEDTKENEENEEKETKNLVELTTSTGSPSQSMCRSPPSKTDPTEQALPNENGMIVPSPTEESYSIGNNAWMLNITSDTGPALSQSGNLNSSQASSVMEPGVTTRWSTGSGSPPMPYNGTPHPNAQGRYVLPLVKQGAPRPSGNYRPLSQVQGMNGPRYTMPQATIHHMPNPMQLQFSTPQSTFRNGRFPAPNSSCWHNICLNSSGSDENQSPGEFDPSPPTSINPTQVERFCSTPTNIPTPSQLQSAVMQNKLELNDSEYDLGRQQHNAKERARRARIKLACDHMRSIVPGMNGKTDKATVFEFAAQYISFLKKIIGSELEKVDKEFLKQCNPY